jgi:hypothetical protein
VEQLAVALQAVELGGANIRRAIELRKEVQHKGSVDL